MRPGLTATRVSRAAGAIRSNRPATAERYRARGAIEAIVANHDAVNDAALEDHRAGYSGVASLKDTRRGGILFVPGFAGLDFEHILEYGTRRPTGALSRHWPMELRVGGGRGGAGTEAVEPTSGHRAALGQP